ncbi:MAG: relaxase domain-containing protein [Chitinophagales bacterium]|nr:relaxase domain-containing protein [Chitinophagales bacterium]
MLRITQSKNAAGAAKYFDEGLQRADYFAKEEQTVGAWGGKAAARLGLSGKVQKEDFVALCHNKAPDGGRLNPRHSVDRKVGYDFTFSVPKSVSVVYAVTGDARILQAFEQSVERTMKEIERRICTQTGQGKDKHYQPTGEMMWASFTHRTSRPVDGVPDPHLHRHCFAINSTWNEKAQRFQAGEFGPIKQQAPYYEAAFESRMAAAMVQLGYSVQRRGLSWEVANIADQTLQKFSRRTVAIEARARREQQEHGVISARQKDQLGALTRAQKQAGQPWSRLCDRWRRWLTDEEREALAQSSASDKAAEKKKGVSAEEAVARAGRHLFERKTVVKEYQLKAEALRRGYGEILPRELEPALQQGEYYRREIKNQCYITTREAVAEEYRLLRYVREGMGKQEPLNPQYQPQAIYLNAGQKAAIEHALTDRNQVTIIAGGAGTGKTTLMKEVRDGIEAGGKKLMGFAPSAAASRGVLRSEGFSGADTLAQLLHNPKMQEQCKGNVIWVDEAGLVGNKDMNALFDIARQQNARLLLTGDIRQHSAVAAGDALRILEQEAGIPVARVHKIQRQKNSQLYKQAVRLAAQGKGDAALFQLDRMGAVIEEADGKKRRDRLVEDYVQHRSKGKRLLIIAPTHKEGREVTDCLRQRLKQEEQLGKAGQAYDVLKNLNWTGEHKSDAFHYQQTGLVLEFHQNAQGHRKGERWQVVEGTVQNGTIMAVSETGQPERINLQQSERFTIYRQEKLELAQGDVIRVTKGGRTNEGTRINNGDIFTIHGFTEEGHLRLHTGKTLAKSFGHVTYGYVTTSHSSQGKTVDHILIAQSGDSFPASNQQQFYVSISRGREACRIYTDDKKALEQAVKQNGQRMTAREVSEIDRQRQQSMMPPAGQGLTKEKEQHHGPNLSL